MNNIIKQKYILPQIILFIDRKKLLALMSATNIIKSLIQNQYKLYKNKRFMQA